MMHLDSDRYAALVAGTLDPVEARALSAHLDGECERCEQFLASLGGADGADGATDAAIAGALPTAVGAGNDLEFARIMREVGAGALARRRRVLSAVAGVLVVAAVGGLLFRGAREPVGLDVEWSGVKGAGAQVIPIRLRFLEMMAGGAIQKGISGERVSATSNLVFEVEAARAADLALVRVASGGGAELVWRSRVAGGRAQVMVGGRPAAYPLAAISGAQRFVLIASDSPIDDARALAAAAALAPPARLSADAPALDGLSLDAIDVLVR